MSDGLQNGLIDADVRVASFFCGNYLHNLDPKRRLTIPSEWRNLVKPGERFFIMPSVGKKRHLFAYPSFVMAPKLRHIHALSMADEEGRNYLRIMGARSEIVGFDSQGRIRVRDELLDHAGLETEVMLIGNFEGFELWNPNVWEGLMGELDAAGLEKASKYVGV